jgi:hypothetical protein
MPSVRTIALMIHPHRCHDTLPAARSSNASHTAA